MKDPIRHAVLIVALVVLGTSIASTVLGGDDVEQDAVLVGSPQPAEASAAPAPSAVPEMTPVAVEPSLAPTPSLPEDLPRKKAADVPRFVGPATLKVSGKPGAYRWDEVLFGAQEVEARVVLEPRRESCAARVRLSEDGKPIVDEWFLTESGAKEAHEVILGVDYATGKLKVDSDCATWSVRLEPLDDPELAVTIEEKPYPVRGDTVAELEAQTKHIKGKWAAYTKWFTSWDYWTGEADDGETCDVVSGQASVEVTMTMPRWKAPRGVDPAVEAEWERVRDNLLVHELGHVTIALQGADAIDDRLDKGFTAETCKKVSRLADKKANRIFERYSRASTRYDKETGHGRSQGTWFK